MSKKKQPKAKKSRKHSRTGRARRLYPVCATVSEKDPLPDDPNVKILECGCRYFPDGCVHYCEYHVPVFDEDEEMMSDGERFLEGTMDPYPEDFQT